MEQNLANLYRPRCFADVVGQPLAVETLKRIASADGIVARAVFCVGPGALSWHSSVGVFGTCERSAGFRIGSRGAVCIVCR